MSVKETVWMLVWENEAREWRRLAESVTTEAIRALALKRAAEADAEVRQLEALE